MLDAFVLLVEVVILVWRSEVGLVAASRQSASECESRTISNYPMFMRVVIPAPFAPRFCSLVFGKKM